MRLTSIAWVKVALICFRILKKAQFTPPLGPSILTVQSASGPAVEPRRAAGAPARWRSYTYSLMSADIDDFVKLNEESLFCHY